MRLLLLTIFSCITLSAADVWDKLDPDADKVAGTRTEKAYAELQLKAPATPIIVAVIDSGVDIAHEDLQGHIWINEKELRGNPGVDDDGNGYIDDFNGWNYLGSKDGKKQVDYGTLEMTRELARMLLEKSKGTFDPKNEAYFLQVRQAYVDGFQFRDNKFNYDMEFDESSIIGDDPTRLDDIGYGNNNVIPRGCDHGTHVSGIIAAVRGNGIGIDGQCAWVKIMPLVVVPEGDERDKDVANAIFYAVNNGAKIISCSFGKGFCSPQYHYVEKAILYAESKNVLIVHAAGNDSSDLRTTANFPNPFIKENNKSRHYSNWIEVGASSKTIGKAMIAYFSNYSPTQVDIFAPGEDVYSLFPHNQYMSLDGTSMAAPEVSGVAALVWTQYPQLSAADLRTVLLRTSHQYPTTEVMSPDHKTLVHLADLCISGGIVDAYAALTYLRDTKGIVIP